MLPLLISIMYAIWIIISSMIIIAYKWVLKNYTYLLITLLWTYSLWKWLILKLPEINTMVWIWFWEALLFWLLLFSFIVLPFFWYFEKYIKEGDISIREKKIVFWLFIWFLVFHSIPEAIQIWYQYTFGENATFVNVLKAIIEEIPEFIMLLSIYILVTNDQKSSLILSWLTWVLFPISALLVYVLAEQNNVALAMITKNILLWFYIVFGIMCINILLKYNRKYIILFIFIIVLFIMYRYIIWI